MKTLRARSGQRYTLSATTVFAIVTLMVTPAQAQTPISSTSLHYQSSPFEWAQGRPLARAVPDLGTIISLSLQDATLEEAINLIAERGGLRIAHGASVFKSPARLTMEIRGASVLEALERVLDGSGLGLELTRSGQVIVHQKAASVTPPQKQLISPPVSIAPVHDVEGFVTAEDGRPLPGVNVVVKATMIGTATNIDGRYRIQAPSPSDTLVFSFVGYMQQEVPIDNRQRIDVSMLEEVTVFGELVVVGYGVQERGDITGSVASLNRERLESLPNVNVAQALQGAIPGVMVQTSAGGAAPNEVLMIRGRNSITASNAPLIVVDGVPYGGNIMDLNTSDVESIDVLKDASAAAIYGSRGANGVILITTKEGYAGRPVIAYDGKMSVQRYVNLPTVLSPEEFFAFKMQRAPHMMTEHEREIFESGVGANWYDLAVRDGFSHQHNLSVSGGSSNVNYYISGSVLDIQGLAVNDDFLRATGRINFDSRLNNWLSFGTRTQLSQVDQSGVGPDFDLVFRANPLGRPYNEDGELSIYPWVGSEDRGNPLESTVWTNTDESFQIGSSNFVVVEPTVMPGLSYRLNAGVRRNVRDIGTYRGRQSTSGFEQEGSADTDRAVSSNLVIENILTYERRIGAHHVTGTAVYSNERDRFSSNRVHARGFPHDFLSWYSIPQAQLIVPSHLFEESSLVSQMARLNYSYDSRYLLTITGRRDGFSGFGADTKWGIFPSVALGWNVANESFFPWEGTVNELKLRGSWGLNGNQAVGAYQSISRLSSFDMIDGTTTLPGYVPSVLGQDNLGWESSNTFNLGLDFALFGHRLAGDVNLYQTNTSDLLLRRSISPVHGISTIVENIGETRNSGVELSLTARPIQTNAFSWQASGNLAYVRNEIVDLYGDGSDDVANAWFIGSPVRVNYGYEWLGTWQIDEAEQAAVYGSQPGYVKLNDLNGDGRLTADDRLIIGQQDPSLLWGLSNSLSFKSLTLYTFFHGVHGVTRINPLMTDLITENQVRRNTMKKDWWTPENPTNDWVANHFDAEEMSGIRGRFYQDASFVRLKDVMLSFNVPRTWVLRAGMNRLQMYVSGRNLATFSLWRDGLDPEINDQFGVPLQREFVIGANVSF